MCFYTSSDPHQSGEEPIICENTQTYHDVDAATSALFSMPKAGKLMLAVLASSCLLSCPIMVRIIDLATMNLSNLSFVAKLPNDGDQIGTIINWQYFDLACDAQQRTNSTYTDSDGNVQNYVSQQSVAGQNLSYASSNDNNNLNLANYMQNTAALMNSANQNINPQPDENIDPLNFSLSLTPATDSDQKNSDGFDPNAQDSSSWTFGSDGSFCKGNADSADMPTAVLSDCVTKAYHDTIHAVKHSTSSTVKKVYSTANKMSDGYLSLAITAAETDVTDMCNTMEQLADNAINFVVTVFNDISMLIELLLLWDLLKILYDLISLSDDINSMVKDHFSTDSFAAYQSGLNDASGAINSAQSKFDNCMENIENSCKSQSYQSPNVVNMTNQLTNNKIVNIVINKILSVIGDVLSDCPLNQSDCQSVIDMVTNSKVNLATAISDFSNILLSQVGDIANPESIVGNYLSGCQALGDASFDMAEYLIDDLKNLPAQDLSNIILKMWEMKAFSNLPGVLADFLKLLNIPNPSMGELVAFVGACCYLPAHVIVKGSLAKNINYPPLVPDSQTFGAQSAKNLTDDNNTDMQIIFSAMTVGLRLVENALYILKDNDCIKLLRGVTKIVRTSFSLADYSLSASNATTPINIDVVCIGILLHAADPVIKFVRTYESFNADKTSYQLLCSWNCSREACAIIFNVVAYVASEPNYTMTALLHLATDVMGEFSAFSAWIDMDSDGTPDPDTWAYLLIVSVVQFMLFEFYVAAAKLD